MRMLIVVGSGIAGLFTALRAREAGVRDVLIVTKADLEESATRYAQGGIAAAIGDGDSRELHQTDTLGAGADLCDPEAVRVSGENASTELVMTSVTRRGIDDASTRSSSCVPAPVSANHRPSPLKARPCGSPTALPIVSSAICHVAGRASG